MGATVKTRKPGGRRGNRWAHLRKKLKKPNLRKQGSTMVPSHMVTPDNPTYKGKKFLPEKK